MLEIWDIYRADCARCIRVVMRVVLCGHHYVYIYNTGCKKQNICIIYIYFIQGVYTHKANVAAGRTSRLFLREILLLFYLLFVDL